MSRQRESDEDKHLEWGVRRARENPGLCMLLIIFEIVLGAGVNTYYGHFYALFAVVFVTLALLPFYGSYRYVLTPEQIEVYGPMYCVTYEWEDFDAWRVYEEDLRLSFADGDRTPLVLFAPRRVDEVIQYVQRYLPRTLDDY